jgi:hypothetical protein
MTKAGTVLQMARFADKVSGSWTRLYKHVSTRRFLGRNVVVLLLLLCLSIYQIRPWWVDVLVVVVYTLLLLGFEWVLALFLPEEEQDESVN